MVASRYHGNAEVVRRLLGHGAKVNAEMGVKVTNSASAVFFAATNGDREMVRLLLDRGGRVNEGIRMQVGGVEFLFTPLLNATSRRDTAMVEYLLEKGADPNVGDGDKITPLGWAALGNHAAAVKPLVAKGARVDHVDEKGMTPFVYETERPHLNEAALIAGTNPELDIPDAQRRNRARERQPARDSVLQRALDVVTSLEIYQKR